MTNDRKRIPSSKTPCRCIIYRFSRQYMIGRIKILWNRRKNCPWYFCKVISIFAISYIIYIVSNSFQGEFLFNAQHMPKTALKEYQYEEGELRVC